MRNNSPILGACLMIVGLIIAIIGYEQYANIVCYCPAQIVGQPSNCHCGEIEEIRGHVIIYSGIAIATSGMVILGIQLLRKSRMKS